MLTRRFFVGFQNRTHCPPKEQNQEKVNARPRGRKEPFAIMLCGLATWRLCVESRQANAVAPRARTRKLSSLQIPPALQVAIQQVATQKRISMNTTPLISIGIWFCLATTSAFGQAANNVTDHQTYTLTNKIVYSNVGDRELLLDAYIPKAEGQYPAVLVIHGGAWRFGDRKQLSNYAQSLAEKGFSCFAIDYRLAPKHKFPAQIEDCRVQSNGSGKTQINTKWMLRNWASSDIQLEDIWRPC